MTQTTLQVFFLIILTLTLTGLCMVGSATAMMGNTDTFLGSYLFRQLVALIPSSIAGVSLALINYRVYKVRWVNWALLTVMLIVLSMVFLPEPIGHPINGSSRWIGLTGSFVVQPSEFVKVGIVLFLSSYYARLGSGYSRFWLGVVRPLVYLSPVILLVMLEPDFGTTLIMTATIGVMLLAAGARWRYLIPLGVIAVAVIGVAIALNPNRVHRLSTDREENHQATQSLVAIHQGGIWGVGYGRGIQKYHYVSEAHTDFIFSVVGEELGLVGTLSIVGLYLVLLGCGVRITLNAADRQGELLAFGVTFLMAVQISGNLCVVTHLVPTKGLALPFLSYGGSSLLSTFINMGLLYSVGRQSLHQAQYRSHLRTLYDEI